jgi:hypothetical protein
MDYQDNVPWYEEFQEYFRMSQVPLLAIHYSQSGAKTMSFSFLSVRRLSRGISPMPKSRRLMRGHFAVENDAELIVHAILTFLREKSLWELDVGLGVI